MITMERGHAAQAEFRQLVRLLDKELWHINGSIQEQLENFNQVSEDEPAILAMEKDIPIGCVCFRKIDQEKIEVKRMYVLPEYRGQGVATDILRELEAWALELGFTTALLETAGKMEPAVQLYQQNGYVVTANYPPYVDVAESVCMMKKLS